MREAAAKGISVIALTDHDTLAGLPEAEQAAREQGIRLIAGIELDILYTGGEFHMLGLRIKNWRGSALEETLLTLQQDRTRRNLEILAAMRRDGFTADYSELEALAEGDIIGRPHIAQLLVAKKIVKNTNQAFQRYLKKGMPWYVSRRGLSAKEAADLIHKAGGLAIIAHPMSLYLGWKALPERIGIYRDQGVDGIEAWHSNSSCRECVRLQNIARELGMLVSAGSDFHGGSFPSRKLGYTCEDDRPIEDSFAEPFL
jgi:predicted metal-dependent phosphoesterase TrpH